jgi:hypothetical protein
VIAPAKRHRSADAPSALPARAEWLPTEREIRESAAAMEDTLNRRAARAMPRRFTGAPLTGFGALA